MKAATKLRGTWRARVQGALLVDEVPDQRIPSIERDRLLGKAFRGCGNVALVLVILFLLIGVALGPLGGHHNYRQSFTMQQSRTLCLALFQYANDNNGAYPDGNTSTKVFQTLMDKGYLTDPAVFYFPMPAKTKPEAGQKLKPENVCFDMTGGGVNQYDSELLPMVYTTGYRVTYVRGGAALPLHPSGPFFIVPSTTWPLSFLGFETQKPMQGMGVCYLGNRAMWLRLEGESMMEDQAYSMAHFVPANFDAKGKTYRQLTPEGVLPAEK